MWTKKENPAVSQELGTSIVEALDTLGISLERGSGRNFPGEWLARGKLGEVPDAVLQPQPGKYTNWGVFFADNYGGLVVPRKGYVYVINSRDYEWLSVGSPEWNRIYARVADEHHLDTSLIGEGLEAEGILYKSHCVYQPHHGYATLNFPLPLNRVNYLLNYDGNIFTLEN
jgi:hypothetical protein